MSERREKARVDEFDAVLGRLEKRVAAIGSDMRFFAKGAVAVALVVGFALALFLRSQNFSFEHDKPGLILFVLPGGIAGLGLIGLLTYQGEKRRAKEKVAFVKDLYEVLADDLMPRSSIVLDLDLTRYDEGSKEVPGRTGRAVKYSDKWLHFRATLADGTAVEIVRQAGIKAKFGSIEKEKRRLFVSLRPVPGRYALEALAPDQPASKRLKHGIEQACDEFHDAPEAFHAKLSGSGGVLEVKVVQEDAPILAREVLAVIERALVFLASLRAA